MVGLGGRRKGLFVMKKIIFLLFVIGLPMIAGLGGGVLLEIYDRAKEKVIKSQVIYFPTESSTAGKFW